LKFFLKAILFALIAGSCASSGQKKNEPAWRISVLPSSVRLNPVRNTIIDAVKSDQSKGKKLLDKNWIYNGVEVSLSAARGEYVSFQLVISNNTDSTLKGINVKMSPFKNMNSQFTIEPELFLEWAVEVKTLSTGYPKASLGTGWYPDALIPFKYIQAGSSKNKGSWIYPLQLPDFNNRIDNQRSQIIWVDQYIPFDYKDATPGTYRSIISVTIGNKSEEIPINLNIWGFAIPNENRFKGSLQHEGFLSRMDEKQELEVYQLFKRNRVSLMEPRYEPELTVSKVGNVSIQWNSFDNRLKKYFSGEAFTTKYGYNYGPGYGEPIETYLLPFDVYGKSGSAGWPDIGKPEVERNPENRSVYMKTIQMVRGHLQPMINPQKTDITMYLNGLDESYFPEAWDRMVYYGDMFKKLYPEAQFRVDGGYSEEAMKIIQNSINSWATHTINYDIDKMEKYQKIGIKDWLYGPMIYESRVNSWVGSSTFLDLPLVNDRGISWSTWKYKAYSWISWGVGAGWKAAWYDPETWKSANDGGNSKYDHKKLNGNALLIYSPGIVPNVNGVCPSIRLKTMRNGIQEYEYMRLLSELDKNTDRVDKIVNSIINQPFGRNSIGNLDVWSYDAEQWDQSRIKLGELINQINCVVR
jgi:hypothetical protein